MDEVSLGTGRQRTLCCALLAAVLLATLVPMVLCQITVTPFSGWDIPQYTAMGARFMTGDRGALTNGLVAPLSLLMLGVPIHWGVDPELVHRVLAMLFHIGLMGGAFVFTLALARDAGLSRGRAMISAALLSSLVASTPAIASLSTEPWTDHLSAIPTCAALACLPRVGHSTRAAAALGLCMVVAYLARYVTLTPDLLMVGGAGLQLLLHHRRGLLTTKLLLARGALIAAPLATTVLLVTAWLSGGDIGFSYGANSQIEGNLALDIDRKTLRPNDSLVHVLNDDGTLGFAHVAPDDPYVFAWYYGFGQKAYRDHAPASIRIRERLADLPGSIAALARGVHEVSPYPSATFVMAIGAWAALLIAARMRSIMMWVALLMCSSTFVGVYLVYLEDPRYILLPQIFVLSALPVVLMRGLDAPSVRERVLPLAAAASLLLWLGANALGLPSHVGLGHLLRGERTPTARAHAELDRVFRAEGLPRKTTPAYDAPVIAAVHPGPVVRNGGRWLPLPRITISESEWAAADDATRRAWLDRTFAAIRRGGAEYILIWSADKSTRALSNLYAVPRREVAGAELIAEIKGDLSSPSFDFRVFRMRPEPSARR